MSFLGGMLRLETEGHGSVLDITAGVEQVIRTGGVQRGLVNVFVVGSTAAVTTMEFEPGGVADLRGVLERLIPTSGAYEHNQRNHDTNAHAHLRAAIIGPSESVPIVDGRMMLGTWQQIVLVDFDDRPRTRSVSVGVLS